MDISTKILSEITVYMKYAKYLENKSRRETWQELVTRNRKMHLKKYPELKDEIMNAYKFIIVHTYLLMIGEHFQKQCFYY